MFGEILGARKAGNPYLCVYFCDFLWNFLLGFGTLLSSQNAFLRRRCGTAARYTYGCRQDGTSEPESTCRARQPVLFIAYNCSRQICSIKVFKLWNQNNCVTDQVKPKKYVRDSGLGVQSFLPAPSISAAESSFFLSSERLERSLSKKNKTRKLLMYSIPLHCTIHSTRPRFILLHLLHSPGG